MFNTILGILQILLAIGFIGFWVIFYFTEYKNPKSFDESAFKHEKSFPLPDLGWITPCLFVAGFGMLMEQGLSSKRQKEQGFCVLSIARPAVCMGI